MSGSRTPTETRVLAGAILGTIAAILPAFLVGAIAPQAQDELGFDHAGLGVLVAVPFLAAGITSVLLGRGVERLGASTALRFSSSAAVVSGLGLAVAPTYEALAAMLAFAGCINAMAQPGANLLVARGIDPSRQGLAFGLKQSAMPGATLLAGLAVPGLALTLGWRWVFVAGAAIALIAVVVIPPGTGDRVPLRARRSGARPRRDVPLAPLLALATGAGLGAAAAGALAAFLVSAGVAAGLSDSNAGYLLALGSAIGITVRVAVGARADRRGGGQLPMVAAMLVGGAFAFAIYVLDTPASLLIATPLGFGLGWAWPGLFNFSVVRNNPSAPAAATGVTQTGTYIGAMLGPLTFGWLAEHQGFGTAWLVGATWFVGVVVAVVVGRTMMIRVKQARGVAAHDPLR